MLSAKKEKQQKTLDSNPKDNKDAKHLIEGIKNYTSDLEKLNQDLQYLCEDRSDCFAKFDGDIPQSVKDARSKKRGTASSPRGKKSQKPDLPLSDDIY